ncbi:hypothetical protein Lfu02_05290 [Longispora fulva]|uniref:Uncharacterized protein n=1 Tax=Longispora fulva TaxID=619741 RepID=A0A8J7KHH4_9ACTN|nr:hypothetical protein [Longispora fulva]MBG6135604.1 hypothetical protein [Longispora fulva]GIG56157.1 hypothetical protein Lfu02_05290 [Longispora fulva]
MTAPEPLLPARRRVDPDEPRRYHMTMRSDFLTPRGKPYKWQEVTAEVHRSVRGSATPTVVPVRYEWQRVSSRTGTPAEATAPREWTFARGQGFDSVLLHTDVAGRPAQRGPAAANVDVSYPALPKAPAVDMLLVLSWDVITFEMMCTHLMKNRALSRVGGTGELHGISGTWAELKFSDPGAVGVFRNATFTARHLGYGQIGGRPVAVHAAECLDCELTVTTGPVAQRGRSSYWVVTHVDVETGDLLHAEMTEMIVATVTGADGAQVPVPKRRRVRMSIEAQAGPGDAAAGTAGHADPVALAEAVRMAERVSEYVRWQTASLEKLPQGAAQLAVMGFRSTVGADSAGVYRQVRALRTGLQAMADGEEGAAGRVGVALAEHRRHLEGLLAFGQIAVDEATRLGVQDEPRRKALSGYIGAVRADLITLLKLIDRLEGRT